jgi:transcription antitermination protein NusB
MHRNRLAREIALKCLHMWEADAEASHAIAVTEAQTVVKKKAAAHSAATGYTTTPPPPGVPRVIKTGPITINYTPDTHLAQIIAREMTLPDTLTEREIPEAEAESLRRLGVAMALAAWDFRPTSDAKVAFHAPQWPAKQQPAVDRAILRLATWELIGNTGKGDAGDPTPAEVVLNEAIELARHYSTENSPAFVNGVLDAIHKEHQSLAGTLLAGGLPPVL